MSAAVPPAPTFVCKEIRLAVDAALDDVQRVIGEK
jgi:hypothetical protein